MKKSKTVSAPAAPKVSVRRRLPKWALENNGEPSSNDEVYYLRSIGRALEVLNCFDGQTPLSLKEISGQMKLPESSLFRVLRTLEHHEYLQQHRDGTYQLAPRLIFGWLVRAAEHVRETARPEMEKLVNAFNETASLAYLFDDRIHVLDCLETFHEIRMTNKIGRVLPPHCSAMGKAITAFQDRLTGGSHARGLWPDAAHGAHHHRSEEACLRSSTRFARPASPGIARSRFAAASASAPPSGWRGTESLQPSVFLLRRSVWTPSMKPRFKRPCWNRPGLSRSGCSSDCV